MKTFVVFLIACALSIAPISSHAQIYVPAVNTEMTGCQNGDTLMVQGSGVGCTTGTPTMGTCGSGSPSVSGRNLAGTITAGGGILTSCTMNFSKTMSAIPKCVATASGGAIWISAVSTTAITFTGVSLTSMSINYNCWGAN